MTYIHFMLAVTEEYGTCLSVCLLHPFQKVLMSMRKIQLRPPMVEYKNATVLFYT